MLAFLLGVSSVKENAVDYTHREEGQTPYNPKSGIQENLDAKNNKLIDQFEDPAYHNSEFASTKEKYTVLTSRFECSTLHEKNHFSLDSKEVKIKCIITDNFYSKIKANVGKITDNIADYGINCVYDKESQILTCDFHENTVETNEISLALISYENTIIDKTRIQLFLISSPVVSNLVLVDPPARIYRGDTLEFKVTITKPTVSKLQGLVRFADGILVELTSTYESVSLYRHAENSTEFRFEFTVPLSTGNGVHQLCFQVLTEIAERSQVLQFEINVVDKPILDCKVEGNNHLKYRGKINLYCEVSAELKSMKFKFSFDEKNYYGDESLINDRLSFEYGEQETEVLYIYVAAYQGNTKIVSALTDAEIHPSPNISEVVDFSENATYIVDDVINLQVTIDRFYDIKNAEILWAFVDHKEDEVVNWTDSHDNPIIPVRFNHSVMLLCNITVPDSMKNGGKKFIKLKFTDEAKQTCIATTKSPVLLRKTVLILDSKLGQAAQNSTQVAKYKKDDIIKLTLNLSNLMDDWENNIKFGYKFGDGNLIFTKSFDVTECKAADNVLEISINIMFPYDFEIPMSGKTTLYVRILDKHQNYISPEVVHGILFENFQNISTHGGGAIALIVISVLVFIVLSVVDIYFFIRKRIWRTSYHFVKF